jgi:hypothetical protein
VPVKEPQPYVNVLKFTHAPPYHAHVAYVAHTDYKFIYEQANGVQPVEPQTHSKAYPQSVDVNKYEHGH